MVPVLDLSRRLARFANEFAEVSSSVLRSGQMLLGPRTNQFETEFAGWSGHRHAIAVSSGAAAIQLGLYVSGVGAGDEVLVPAFTAVPTASAVCALGAVPVPVEVEADTAALDPAAARRALTALTRAVVPVHLYGRAVSVPDLGVTVIEDAAQAHGAVRNVGSIATAYSFYPTKNLGGIGDGGAVVTDDDEVANRLRSMRVHGMNAHYVHCEVSQNFRMSELEAAWLSLTLPHLHNDNERRREIARHYHSAAPQLRWHPDHESHVFHLCVFRSANRAATQERLRDHGIATAVHYPLALTQQPAYRQFARAACPTAEAWAAECVTVPCFAEMTDSEVERIGEALRLEVE